MFHCTEKPAHIESLKSFRDKTGERPSGTRISLSMTFTPDVLDLFESGLCAALYRPADVISSQTDTGSLVRRFGGMDRIAFGKTIVGAGVRIRSAMGLFGSADIRLNDETIDRIKLHLLESSVEVRCDVKAHPGGDDHKPLNESLGNTVEVDIVPPEHATYADAGGDDGRQGDLIGEAADDEGDEPDDGGDGVGIASAVMADPDAAEARSDTKVTRRRRRRAFPAALDGTGGDPFAAAEGTIQ